VISLRRFFYSLQEKPLLDKEYFTVKNNKKILNSAFYYANFGVSLHILAKEIFAFDRQN
jgi:hypothetical protein